MQHVLTTIIILIAVTCTVTGMAIAATFPECFHIGEKCQDAVIPVPEECSGEGGMPVAAFQAVMAGHGVDRGAEAWARTLAAAPGNLTAQEKMALAAKSCGLSARVEMGLRLADLEGIVSAHGPVIASLDGGEYAVVAGVDREHVTLGSGVVLGTAVFEARWAGGECLVIGGPNT